MVASPVILSIFGISLWPDWLNLRQFAAFILWTSFVSTVNLQFREQQIQHASIPYSITSSAQKSHLRGQKVVDLIIRAHLRFFFKPYTVCVTLCYPMISQLVRRKNHKHNYRTSWEKKIVCSYYKMAYINQHPPAYGVRCFNRQVRARLLLLVDWASNTLMQQGVNRKHTSAVRDSTGLSLGTWMTDLGIRRGKY